MLRLLPLLLAVLVGCGRLCTDRSEPASNGHAKLSGELVVLSDLPPTEREALRKILQPQASSSFSLVFVDRSTNRAADLILLQGPSVLEGAAGFARLAADSVAPLPEAARGPEDRYVAIDRRARLLAVGRLMANVPTGILDVAEPRFAGKLARPSSADEGLILLLTSVLADRGAPVAQRVLEGLVANEGETPRVHDAESALSALLSRDVDLALTDHVAARRQALGSTPPADAAAVDRAISEARFVAVYPDAADGGVAWTGTILALPEPKPGQEAAHVAAKTVAEWLLSLEGQAAWSAATGAYAAHPGATSAPGLRSEDTFRWSPTSLSERAELRAQIVEWLAASQLP